MLCMTSCGHNVVTHSKGMGIDLSWDGSSYIPNIRIGSWDVSNAVIKENVEVEVTTSTQAKAASSLVSGNKTTTTPASGGGTEARADGGIAIKMKTGPQTNGYVADLMKVPTLTDKHVEIAKSIYGVKSNMSSTGAMVKTDTITVSTNSPAVVKTTTETKTEEIKDDNSAVKTTTTVSEVPVSATTEQAATKAVEAVKTAVKTDMWYYIAGAAALVLGGGGLFGYLIGRKKKKTTATDTTK